MQPAPAGKFLLVHAVAAMDRTMLAQARVRSFTAEQSGTVRIGSFLSALVQLTTPPSHTPATR